jgi:hypothetical protein
VELSFRLNTVANEPLAKVQRGAYVLILDTLRLEEGETVLPPGLTIETYALRGTPQAKPLTFEPLQGTAQSLPLREPRREAHRCRNLEEAAVLMQTLSHGPDGNFNWDECDDLHRLARVLDGDETAHLRSVPFQVSVAGGAVTIIREQYAPENSGRAILTSKEVCNSVLQTS